MSFDAWLQSHGLERYAGVFRDNDVDAATARLLTDADLRELGLTLGHRRRFLAGLPGLADDAAPGADPAAERRQLTVLFCDLVGSVALAERLDPEELRALLHRYRAAGTAVITRFEGHVARFVGDGILAYFGWPRAHEDDAERAVRAALTLHEAVRDLAVYLDLRVHIGIATGPVVVGQAPGETLEAQLAVGPTPNLAARLQGLAGAGETLIGPMTRRLVGERFALVDRGEHTLKGIRDPVRAWSVAGLAPVDGRFEAARGRHAPVPMVGREEEVRLLVARWELAMEGEGQVVRLSGEAGIGKSRLVHALRARLASPAAPAYAFLGLQCSPHHADSPLFPVIEHLSRSAGVALADASGGALERIAQLVAASFGPAQEEHAEITRVFASLLSLQGATTTSHDPPPAVFRERALEAVLAYMAARSRAAPVLVVIEDAHWADSTTRELLALLVSRVQQMRLLLIVTSRPAPPPDWSGLGHVTSYALNRLTRRQSAELVESVVKATILSVEVVARIVAVADGVPLFVEELARSVVESGVPPQAFDDPQHPSFAIPPTLHDSLIARLDRLGVHREVAQVAACIGREFALPLLAAVLEWPDRRIVEAVDTIATHELVFRQGVGDDVRYLFKHALVQDAAYQTLTKSRREQWHARIARALVAHFPGDARAHPEIVAFHFAHAGHPADALSHWRQAGRIALSRSAYVEAIHHLEAALHGLDAQVQGGDRDREELAIRVQLGPAYQAITGMGSPEAGANYERACELDARLGRSREGFQGLWGHWLYCNLTGRTTEAKARAHQLLVLSRELGDDEYVLQAHHARWTTLSNLGDLVTTRFDIEQGLRLYDPERHGHHAHAYGGHDPGVCCRTQGAMCLWALGLPGRADRLADEGVTLARRLDHPFSLAVGLWFAGAVKLFRGDAAGCRNLAAELLELSASRAFRSTEPHARFQFGWAQAMAGEVDEGVRLMEQGESRLAALGQHGWRHICLATLADVHARHGDLGRALSRIDEAIDVAERGGIASWRPEFLRRRAIWMHAAGRADRAVASAMLADALDTAREQGALTFELRIRTSMLDLTPDASAHHAASVALAECLARCEEPAAPDVAAARERIEADRR